MSEFVLVVDDDRDTRELLAAVVELSGHTAELAADGRDALAKLRAAARRPCLVIADLMMPHMDGRELRREMLGDPALAGVPYVVISGIADLSQDVRTLQVADALTKPVDVDALLASISRHC